jgi:hypothetical protein
MEMQNTDLVPVHNAKEKLMRSSKRAEWLIVDHPGLSLGTAVLIGAVLGWWIKRK